MAMATASPAATWVRTSGRSRRLAKRAGPLRGARHFANEFALCCGFKATAQARSFPDAEGVVSPPPHGFRSALPILRKSVRTTWRCAGRRKLEQPPRPLQEAERSRCAGGRAAWMPREARQAMDGPSRRPPERRWSEGTPAKPGPDDGASPFGFFWVVRHPDDCQKRLARGGETKSPPKLGNQLGSNPLATLNADTANEFALTGDDRLPVSPVGWRRAQRGPTMRCRVWMHRP